MDCLKHLDDLESIVRNKVFCKVDTATVVALVADCSSPRAHAVPSVIRHHGGLVAESFTASSSCIDPDPSLSFYRSPTPCWSQGVQECREARRRGLRLAKDGVTKERIAHARIVLPARVKLPGPEVAGKHPLNGHCKRTALMRPGWSVSKENKRKPEETTWGSRVLK